MVILSPVYLIPFSLISKKAIKLIEVKPNKDESLKPNNIKVMAKDTTLLKMLDPLML